MTDHPEFQLFAHVPILTHVQATKHHRHRRHFASTPGNISIFTLPRELIQSIARDYLPTSAEAALVLTCHYMFEVIGGKSLEKLVYKPMILHNVSSWSLFGVVTSTFTPQPEPVDGKREFLQLLAWDLPPGYATYCHEHRILHIRQPKPVLLDRMKFWATDRSCKTSYQIPLGAKGKLPVAAVQLAARGADTTEHLVHYEVLDEVTARHSFCCSRDPYQHDLHVPYDLEREDRNRTFADVTSYCRVIQDQVVLAMRYRAYIPKKRLADQGMCARVKGGCFRVHWPSSSVDDLNLYLELKDLITVAESNNSFMDLSAHLRARRRPLSTGGSPVMRVRLTPARHDGVLVNLDIFASLEQGLGRPQIPELPGMISTAPSGFDVQCEAGRMAQSWVEGQKVELQKGLEKAVREGFQDHEEQLKEVKKSKLHWKISSARMDGLRAALSRKQQHMAVSHRRYANGTKLCNCHQEKLGS